MNWNSGIDFPYDVCRAPVAFAYQIAYSPQYAYRVDVIWKLKIPLAVSVHTSRKNWNKLVPITLIQYVYITKYGGKHFEQYAKIHTQFQISKTPWWLFLCVLNIENCNFQVIWVVTFLAVVILYVDLGLWVGLVFSFLTVVVRTQWY